MEYTPSTIGIYSSVAVVRIYCGYSHCSTETLLICPVYLQYDVCFDRLRTVSAIVPRTIVRHEASTDGPTRWSCSRILRFRTTLVLGAHWQSFDNIYCGGYVLRELSALSISRLRTSDNVGTPSTSCFGTAGTYLPVLSGFRTAHTLQYPR